MIPKIMLVFALFATIFMQEASAQQTSIVKSAIDSTKPKTLPNASSVENIQRQNQPNIVKPQNKNTETQPSQPRIVNPAETTKNPARSEVLTPTPRSVAPSIGAKRKPQSNTKKEVPQKKEKAPKKK